MSYLYLDTSAVVKRYTLETGSGWVQTVMDPASGNTAILSEITLAEFAAAISAKQRTGAISLADRTRIINLFLRHCATEFQLVAANRTIIDKAVTLVQNRPLRGYDAVQLASGLTTKDILATAGILDFIFISADKILTSAAVAEGLTVDNPSNHP